MNQTSIYPIGTPGKKWGADEKAAWLARQAIKRSYRDNVIAKLEPLKQCFNVEQYGALSYDPDRYPLYAVKTRDWDRNKMTALVTGGVHGYETSGVSGAIRFLETRAQSYRDKFNIVVFPCVSPWAYETINRWNPNAIDPNRSFYDESPSEESSALMGYIASQKMDLKMHIDLHETTNTDGSEFRPAAAARDGITNVNWNIPDGFYLVGDINNPVDGFQKAIIESVQKVTHIAPPDDDKKIIGKALSQWGVVNYEVNKLGLCTGFTNASFSTTTEVYPDSPKVDDENCTAAQVAAITAGLDFIINNWLSH